MPAACAERCTQHGRVVYAAPAPSLFFFSPSRSPTPHTLRPLSRSCFWRAKNAKGKLLHIFCEKACLCGLGVKLALSQRMIELARWRKPVQGASLRSALAAETAHATWKHIAHALQTTHGVHHGSHTTFLANALHHLLHLIKLV